MARKQLFSRPLDDREIVIMLPKILKKVRVDPSGVKIRFDDGRMVLSGTVADERARRIAAGVAARIGGNRALENELEVRPGPA